MTEKPVVVYESPKLNQYFVVEVLEVPGADEEEVPVAEVTGIELVLVVDVVIGAAVVVLGMH